MQNSYRVSSRTPFGTQMVELPVVLWLLLVCGAIPFIVMGAITMRATFLNAAAKDAAHAAAKAATFEASEPGQPSAKQLAESTARATASRFPGVTISKIQTSILITDADKASDPPDVRINKLRPSEVIDTSQNVYSVAVEVSGQVEPIARLSLPVLGDIPGLTKPMELKATGIELFENAEGLKE